MEKAVKITVSSKQPVAWHWYSDQKVRIRPQKFWASNTRVSMDMKLFGVDFGNSMIGNFNAKVQFKVGQQRLAVVDDVTKTMKVYFDGKLVKTAPVTLGGPDWLSPSGYAVIMEQERHSKFNAGSIGLKPGDKGLLRAADRGVCQQAYVLGVYVHQALESAWSYVGVSNISHGCVGLLPAGRCMVLQQHEVRRRGPVLNTGAAANRAARGLRRLEHPLGRIRQAVGATNRVPGAAGRTLAVRGRRERQPVQPFADLLLAVRARAQALVVPVSAVRPTRQPGSRQAWFRAAATAPRTRNSVASAAAMPPRDMRRHPWRPGG